MTQSPAPAVHMPPREIPESFFKSLPDPGLPRSNGTKPQPTAPLRALALYDAIIDYMFANPDCTLGDVAKHLQRGRTAISLVMRSDFFRARWLQRREGFNEELNFRLAHKMTGVLELSLQKTKEALETRSGIPLPVLDQVNKTLLDRLGYTPNSSHAPVQVNVQNNTSASAVVGGGAVSASPDAVARAREYLSLLEAGNAASGARPGNAAAHDQGRAFAGGPVVEGEVVESSGVMPDASSA